MFKKILIANRGEIACRVIKTARKMGIATVAVYSDADKNALHVKMADEAVHIGPAPANQSYIVIDKIMDAIRQTGAEAVHPGYGFLSENKLFAEALEKEGVAFIGPPAGAIESMGDKITSKKIAQEADVSTVPGYMGLIEDVEEAVKISGQIGYPVMIKASAGGGGKGMRIVEAEGALEEALTSAKREALSAFGDDRFLVEKFITGPRHVEVQVFGDGTRAVQFFERDCSLQRRNQKVVEEAPAPNLPEAVRQQLFEAAVRLAKGADYRSAGTVEFLYDSAREQVYFLEMNTRLQVEHGVTEEVMGIDLVEWLIRGAAGDFSFMAEPPTQPNGHSIQVRLYAEDPALEYRPTSGVLTSADFPDDVRVETWVMAGVNVSAWYDPMIAKLIVYGRDREGCIMRLRRALEEMVVEGVKTNIPLHQELLHQNDVLHGDYSIKWLEKWLEERES